MVPSHQAALDILRELTNETAVSVEKMETGNQNYVYAIKTNQSDYVLRLTLPIYRESFVSAMYWQQQLLPLKIPLAKFIAQDLAGKVSPFPALLMHRLAGSDLGKIYHRLSDAQKKALAQEMVQIHQKTRVFSCGNGFGYAISHEQKLPYQSWYDFLMHDLSVAADRIAKSKLFDSEIIANVFSIAKILEPQLTAVKPSPFLHDTTVKNVMVSDGQITGIVDVDTLCFGDPLFVLALTYAGSEADGLDTKYADYWAELLDLDEQAKERLSFYRLFHTLWFMGEHACLARNGSVVHFDTSRLQAMYKNLAALWNSNTSS